MEVPASKTVDKDLNKQEQKKSPETPELSIEAILDYVNSDFSGRTSHYINLYRKITK